MPRLGIWDGLSLKPTGDGAQRLKPSTAMSMAAVGMDGVLIDGNAEGLSLTSTTDVLLVNTTA